MAYVTVSDKPQGAKIPLYYDWTRDLILANSTSIVRSDWDVLSGTVDLSAPSFAGAVSMTYVSGGVVEETAEVQCTVHTNTGARLVKVLPLHVSEGFDGTDPATVYVGSGPIGLGVDQLTPVTGVAQLGFTATVSPTAEKAYIAWPVSWGAADFEIDGFPQSGAFSVSSVPIDEVSYYLAESTDLLTAVSLPIRVEPAL